MKYEVFVEGKKYEVEVEEIEANVFSVSIAGKKARISISELGALVEKIEAKPEVKAEVKAEAKAVEGEVAKKVEGEGTPITVAMAGTITKVLKKEGDEVKKGEDILILEAMKMENSISSPKSGKISKIVVTPGDKVAAGDVVAFVV
ncbi:acetyl-CoA carboxylase biotin carboxyl carrier protein subunit [Archaeoglobales archaeon]|nr:MAG: acetyl-CoA carboxylase biotin carboxyl carrier protein subunit [Archaeoglobales archaeon]